MDFRVSYPSLTGRESWPNTPSDQGITAKFQPPCQTNSPHYRSDLLQGSTARPNYTVPGGVPSEECFSDSSSYLSHLSNQPSCDDRGLGLLVFTTTSTPIDQPLFSRGAAMITPCPWASRSFKESGATNTLLEMASDLGSGPITQPSNTQYTGELGLDKKFREPRGGLGALILQFSACTWPL